MQLLLALFLRDVKLGIMVMVIQVNRLINRLKIILSIAVVSKELWLIIGIVITECAKALTNYFEAL